MHPGTRIEYHALRALDPEAERETGFRAGMGFEEGLRRTVEWYRADRGMEK